MVCINYRICYNSVLSVIFISIVYHLFIELADMGFFHQILHATSLEFLGVTYCRYLHLLYWVDPARVLHYIICEFQAESEKTLSFNDMVDFLLVEALFMATLHDRCFSSALWTSYVLKRSPLA